MERLLFNLLDDINFSEEKEIEKIIYEDEDISINRTLSLNQVTEEFDQEDLEIVLLYDGRAKIEFKDEVIDLKPGDILRIKPHDVHKVIYQDRAIWLCIFKKVDKHE